jgi:hypothetical protein
VTVGGHCNRIVDMYCGHAVDVLWLYRRYVLIPYVDTLWMAVVGSRIGWRSKASVLVLPTGEGQTDILSR